MDNDINEFSNKYLEKFAKEIISKAENLDLRYLNEIKEELSTIFEKYIKELAENRELLNLIKDFFTELDINALLDEIKRVSNKKISEFKNEDKRIEKIINLIEDADKIVPNISIIILSRINPNDYIRRIAEPYSFIEEIENSHGEHRARSIMRFFREVCEFLYDNYARILWELVEVLDKKVEINSKGYFGNIINNLLKKLNRINLTELIEPDAAFIRNAAAHGSYEYEPKSKSIIIWDRNKAKIAIDADDLYNRAKKMYELTSMPLFMIFITNINKIFIDNGILELLLRKKDKLLKGETVDMKDVEEKVFVMFKPIINKYKFNR